MPVEISRAAPYVVAQSVFPPSVAATLAPARELEVRTSLCRYFLSENISPGLCLRGKFLNSDDLGRSGYVACLRVLVDCILTDF